MKKRYLLLPLACGFIYLTTTSELPGTTLGPTVQNCAQSGCHSGGAGTTSITSLTLTDNASGNVATTTYVPGHVYSISFKGSNTSNLAKFGFQLQTSAGTFSSPGTGEALLGTTMLTHGSVAIAAVSNVYTATGTWTAPTSGSVTFTGNFNAVNGDGNSTGDKPGTIQTFTYTPQGTAVANVLVENLTVFPNPVIGSLHLKMDGAVAGNYFVSIYNTNGAEVAQQSVAVTGANQELTINTDALANGCYFLQLSKDGISQVKSFVK